MGIKVSAAAEACEKRRDVLDKRGFKTRLQEMLIELAMERNRKTEPKKKTKK